MVISQFCVDDNIPKAIGLWIAEQDFGEDISVGKHPVRHFYQYNATVEGNDSHAYFASGKSVYEISWVGEIDSYSLMRNTIT